MSDNTVVKIEPKIQHPKSNAKSKVKPEPVELEDIVGRRLMVVSTAFVNAVYGCVTMGERRKTRQFLLLMAGALMVQIGILRLAIILMQH